MTRALRIVLLALAPFGSSALAQNQPPTISFSSPAPGITSTYESPATVNLRVTAADPDGTVIKVEYYVNGALLGTMTTPPFAATWNNVPAGNYTLTAKAFDDLNATTTSSPVTIAVAAPDAANVAPSVSPISPLDNSTYTAPAVFLFFASASDNGSVNRVEYYLNNVMQCVRTVSPYGCSIGLAGAGTWTLTVKAFDNQGKATTSAARTLSVFTADPANAAPTITLASPLNNSVSYSPASVWLRSDAADSDGSVNRVEYFVNGGLRGLWNADPYAVNWTGVGPGVYSVVARVWDNQGKSADSAAASVTVNTPVAGNAAPTVSFVLPINNSTFEAPLDTTFVLNTADSNGTINRIEYYVNGAFIGVDANPSTVDVLGMPAGTWSWTAVAFDNQGASAASSAVTTSVMTPTPGNAAPSVSVGQPANGAVYSAPATVPIVLSASDGDGTINRVELFVNNAWVSSFTAPPYQSSLTNAGNGSYAIVGRAYDNLGKSTTTAATTVTVGTNTAPSVSITAPANNSVVQAPGTVNLAAAATDSDGTITKVELYRGATLIATVTAAPYNATDANLAAGSYSYTAKAYDNGGAITTSAAINVTSNAPPSVSISAPANNTALPAPATVNLTATASDSDGALAKVEFYRGTTLIATVTAAPFNAADPNLASGTYSYTAKAYDNNGGITTSAAVAIISDTLPTVAITAPASGASFSAPASINLTASASDADGTISKVEFYDGAALIGTVTSAPYTFNWTNVADGSHTVTARAFDDRNLNSNSAAINLTVNSGPAITVNSPTNGAVYQAGQTVTIAATVTDPDGVRKVEFYRGATLIATATTAPYAASAPNLAAGSYQFSVRAYDNLNAFRDSGPVNVTVNAPPAVSITAPANNAVATAPASVTLTTNTADSDGTITQVQFYNGSTLLGTATAAPFNLALTNLGPGPYTFTARAYDNNGGVTTSAAVNMSVSGGAAVTPVVYQYDELGRLIGVTH